MKQRENLEDIYFQLTPENRACLVACAQLCRSAENAVKKNFAGGETQSVTAAGKQQQGFDPEAEQWMSEGTHCFSNSSDKTTPG